MRRMPVTASGVAPIVVYIVIVLALSWLRFVPGTLEQQTGVRTPAVIDDLVLPFFGSFGPVIVAVVLTARLSGSGGVAALLGEVLRWRVHPRWLGAAVVVPLGLAGSGLAMLAVTARGVPELGVQHLWNAMGILVMAFVFALGEELGWRSYLQRRLQSRWTAAVSALLIGVVWTAWHAPLFADPDAVQAAIPLLPYLVLLVGLSVLFSWVYNATGGSVLLVTLTHALFNASVGSITLELSGEQIPPFIVACAITAWVAVAVVVVRQGPQTLSGRP